MIDEGKKWAKGKYPFTSAGLMRRLLRRINAEIPNHRGNSTVPCFQHQSLAYQPVFKVFSISTSISIRSRIFIHTNPRHWGSAEHTSHTEHRGSLLWSLLSPRCCHLGSSSRAFRRRNSAAREMEIRQLSPIYRSPTKLHTECLQEASKIVTLPIRRLGPALVRLDTSHRRSWGLGVLDTSGRLPGQNSALETARGRRACPYIYNIYL